MAKRKRAIPQYGTVTLNGIDYYRTRVQNADGKLVALYARTPEELYDKELGALEQIDSDTFCRKSPTVADYCEKWLLMQSVHVRATTLIDYTSNHTDRGEKAALAEQERRRAKKAEYNRRYMEKKRRQWKEQREREQAQETHEPPTAADKKGERTA